jgi:ferric-dicitrate binding protein FerR (iron transport regulator)/TolA-binding protein
MMVRRASSADRDSALSRLGRLARTPLSGEVSPEQESKSRWRFRENLAREASASGTTRWLVGAVAAAAVVTAVFFGWRAFSHAPLTFEVDSPAVANQDYLLVPSTAPSAHVRFSDGSDLTLEPGTRGRVAALRADGAAIGLESGKASLHVVHRPETRWSVDAGPFAITVTGTAFDVGWSGADELFEVTLRSGSIMVHGPLATSGIRLTEGERLVVNLKAGQLRVEKIAGAENAPPRDLGTPLAARGSSSEQAPGGANVGAGVDDTSPRKSDMAAQARGNVSGANNAANNAKSSWSKRVAAGDFDGVLADAQETGIDAALARSTLADLIALADAARYKGRADVARRALVAQRERFPSSTAARTAAFLLGRLVESEPESAIAWYDRYLGEAPNGEFASEALGRKLVAVHRVSGLQSARPVAEEYLRRFPHGPYAARARELISQ